MVVPQNFPPNVVTFDHIICIIKFNVTFLRFNCKVSFFLRFVEQNRLRMARGEGEVDPRNQGLRSHFVERVVNLPMFHVAWDYASHTYTSIKESNRLVNFTLTNAERSVNFVAGQAKPVVKKFEKQIQVVDDLACKGLGTLEEKVPLITKNPEQFMGDTRKLYSNGVLGGIQKYGRDKVKGITDYGIQKASNLLNNPLVSSVMNSVDGALMITENYIDYILPPVDDENKNDALKKDDGDEKKNGPLNRLGKISATIRQRTYRTLIVRVQNLRAQTADLMNVPSALVAIGIETVEDFQKYAVTQWLLLISDETDKEKLPKRFPLKQLYPLARPIAKRLVDVYAAMLDRLHLTSAEKSDSNNVSNNVGHSPHIVDSVKDNVMWVIGMITTSTHILPFYVYSWISYFFPKPEVRASEPVKDGSVSREANDNCQDQKNDHNHVNENDISSNNVDHKSD